MSGMLRISLVALALGLGGCGDSEPAETTNPGAHDAANGSPSPPDPVQLIGNEFVSTSIIEAGEERPLVEGTRLRVSFERRRNYDSIGWSAGCNGAWAKVTVTANRLRLGAIASTRMGCLRDLEQQDAWLSEFFRTNPEWELRDGELTLSAGEREIRLQPGDAG